MFQQGKTAATIRAKMEKSPRFKIALSALPAIAHQEEFKVPASVLGKRPVQQNSNVALT